MKTQSLITKKLVEEIQNNNEHSFELLYQQWVSRLYRFVFGYVKSESVADDIVQETFVRIWDRRKSLDKERSFKDYLFTVSYHLIIKEIKRQAQNPMMQDYLAYEGKMFSNHDEAEALLDFDQFTSSLQKAKSYLTPRQREIFELNKEYDLSVAQIAKKLNIKPQVVRNQLSSAMKTIRAHISPLSCMILYLISEM